MICFEIHINAKRICTAGIDSEFGVLPSILTWVKRDLNEFPSENRDKIQKEELTLDLSGHKSRWRNDHENIKWLKSIEPGNLESSGSSGFPRSRAGTHRHPPVAG